MVEATLERIDPLRQSGDQLVRLAHLHRQAVHIVLRKADGLFEPAQPFGFGIHPWKWYAPAMPRPRHFAAAAAAVAAASASPALAARVSLSLAAPSQAEPAHTPEPASQPPTTPSLTPVRFLDKGWWGWSLGAGVAFNSESTDTNLVANFHTFLAEDFEFNFGLGGWYYAQDDEGEDGEEADDALGLNPRFGFRWHFARPQDHADRSWSVYAEAGIGMVFTDHEVPPGGTHYNFTPHAGVGATFAMGDSGARLDLGVRWAHVSNASTSGTDDNPSRDSPMVYAGFMFPF